MQYSVVNLSEVKNNSDFRIDAEYWKPEIRNIKTLLNKWNNCCFGDKIDILTDYHANGSYKILKNHVQMVDNKDYALMIRTVDLENENYKNNVKYISENAYNFLKKTKIFGGEIIINKVGSAGAVFRMPYLNIPVSLGMNQFLIKVKDIISDYVFVFLKTKYGEKLIKQRITGAVPQSIDKDSIRSIPIFVPSKCFQQSIADLVNTSYTLRQSADTLYKEAENILLEELGLKDFKPQNKKCFIKNLSNTQEVGRFDAEYFQPKYEDIIEKIKGYKWGYFVLKDEDINDKNFNPKKDVCYKYIELSNISNNATINNVEMITGDNLPTRARRIVKTNDIIVSSVEGSLNSISLITENYNNSLCSTGFFVLKTQKLNSESLLIFLKNIIGQMQLKRGCKGTILTSIDKNELKQIIIPLLPQSIQILISSKIQQSFENREKSKRLLDVAKRAVEIAIEEDEESGLKYIKENR